MTSEYKPYPPASSESEPAIASRFDVAPTGDVVADIEHGRTMQQVRRLIESLGEDSMRYALLGSAETE